MIQISDQMCEREIIRYQEELVLLRAYPMEDLKNIIRDVGFMCVLCGRCCTTSFNGHVFLLDDDARKAKEICPDALIPAPFFEVCDKTGRFFVSGYTLRAKPDGRCIHLNEQELCTIYQDRFTICRVYPYMLHREPDEKGTVEFRQISGLNEHGDYNHQIPEEEINRIAEETLSYEHTWLDQMIRFYSKLNGMNEFRSVRKVYDERMRDFKKGKEITVEVFYQNEFISHKVSIQDYSGIIS